jgi:hypothetical protein
LGLAAARASGLAQAQDSDPTRVQDLGLAQALDLDLAAVQDLDLAVVQGSVPAVVQGSVPAVLGLDLVPVQTILPHLPATRLNRAVEGRDSISPGVKHWTGSLIRTFDLISSTLFRGAPTAS